MQTGTAQFQFIVFLMELKPNAPVSVQTVCPKESFMREKQHCCLLSAEVPSPFWNKPHIENLYVYFGKRFPKSDGRASIWLHYNWRQQIET